MKAIASVMGSAIRSAVDEETDVRARALKLTVGAGVDGGAGDGSSMKEDVIVLEG